jgi:hypothetical protein
VEKSPCFNQLQSAYRRGHSTETALLKVSNDIYQSADDKSRTLLVQLDLSTAFDTMTSPRYYSALSCRLVLTGTTFKWIRSYM